jgi:hypothetical protein
MNKNIILDAKQKIALEKINKMVTESDSSQVPLTVAQISMISKNAINLKLVLPIKVLSVLYDNKRYVENIIVYIQQRIIDFFNSKQLLPPMGNKYYKIKLLNLAVKVKKESLMFEDSEVSVTKLFEDFESLKFACKLYIWDVKLNTCAKMNLLDDDQIATQFNPELGRICRIANVPIKFEPPPESEAGNLENDSSINSESGDEAANQDGQDNQIDQDNQTDQDVQSDQDNQTNQDTSDQTTAPVTAPVTDPEGSVDEVKESFINSLGDKLTNEDYQYIISTAIFIFIIFLLYNKFK